MNQAIIKRIIPHREPFLFIDNVEATEPGILGFSEFDLSKVEPFIMQMEGMSPAETFEYLILESAAQTFGVVLGCSQDPSGSKDHQHLLLGFEKVEFVSSVKTPAVIKINVELAGQFGEMSRVKFSAEVAGDLIATGYLSVMQKKNEEPVQTWQERNEMDIQETVVETDEIANDFYNKFDPYEVTILDKEEFIRYRDSSLVEPREKEI